MEKTFVVGDIHGGYRALEQVLNAVERKPEDTFIFLGDYADGWSETPQVLDFLMEFRERQSCVFVRGNHDTLCRDWLVKGSSNDLWLFHGGEATVEAYRGIGEETRKAHGDFLEQLTDYYIDEKNRLFLHAGFTHTRGVEHEYFPEMFYWDRSLWETALALDTSIPEESYRYPARLSHYAEIFIGHTPVTRIGEKTPVNAGNVWNVDTGAAFKGPLTVMDAGTKEFWQSAPVWTLYPDEEGRN
ncbi:metallophosphoesterase [Sinomicrobium soli]|uniref:metallophosphoesterase n=1 Tax=Sinomicrobium sp. N-1-3-6 TaxID=2219864 RepID=UPI000DCCD8A0|nr:metallophosphoesterase [Sinomicrobium sp. N-1-3-6]RAV29455.1 serine/threonine protein phosphatase [Sinomicrobium sp. N-1-3-6]